MPARHAQVLVLCLHVTPSHFSLLCGMLSAEARCPHGRGYLWLVEALTLTSRSGLSWVIIFKNGYNRACEMTVGQRRTRELGASQVDYLSRSQTPGCMPSTVVGT